MIGRRGRRYRGEIGLFSLLLLPLLSQNGQECHLCHGHSVKLMGLFLFVFLSGSMQKHDPMVDVRRGS